MKKELIVLTMVSLSLASCVSMGKYETLDSKYAQATKNLGLMRSELDEMKNENAELLRQNQALTTRVTDLGTIKDDQENTINNLRRRIDEMQQQFDTTMENYLQQLSGKNRDLAKSNNLLSVRTRELNEKEATFREKEESLQRRQMELEQAEAKAKRALEAKERELDAVKGAVTKALVGFSDKGLKVETKDGKVYVSMENKLLFPSGSWTVSADGNQALKGLAKVLEDNSELNIIVEGHTDNDAYKGSSSVKDNWDLSVMRATAIVKLLLQYGPKIAPSRIEASGHGEYAPKVPNTSAANKAVNRRTEIILTPNLDDLLKVVNN